MTWEERIADAWSADVTDEERIALIDAVAAERPEDDAAALFERAGARDSAGLEEEAEPLYRRALEAGLDEDRRVQAVIQLASTIRNLGKLEESLALLRAEYEKGRDAPLRDATAAFYALALASSGDAVRAASIALQALAPHLPRYMRSVTGYAQELV
ncbi:tetratricopeptide repeat protein [Microbacterium sp. AZCO]|uniref:tetratricopeptide repeat protein n=1 Tax=Microbacterium sp. AZCO TaxID=3142976 RepID=UPI0031F3DD3C